MKCKCCGLEKPIYWHINNHHQIPNEQEGICEECYFTKNCEDCDEQDSCGVTEDVRVDI